LCAELPAEALPRAGGPLPEPGARPRGSAHGPKPPSGARPRSGGPLPEPGARPRAPPHRPPPLGGGAAFYSGRVGEWGRAKKRGVSGRRLLGAVRFSGVRCPLAARASADPPLPSVLAPSRGRALRWGSSLIPPRPRPLCSYSEAGHKSLAGSVGSVALTGRSSSGLHPPLSSWLPRYKNYARRQNSLLKGAGRGKEGKKGRGG
jgi:hypothetical protein